jgi:enoyl-CoA hydratase
LDTIELSVSDNVAVVRLANPPVNAVSRLMMRELYECFTQLGERRDVGAVVLAAAGDRAFCGGVDLKERSGGAPDSQNQPPRQLIDSGREWRETQASIRHCPVPVIAALDGPAIGAGFGLVGVCDLIIASRRASLGLTEINVGLLGGASKALRMVGPYKARMMFFSGDLVPAEELYRLGAVEQLTEPGEAESAAVALASKFAAKSPIALRMAKESLLRIETMDFDMEAAYRTEQDYTTRLGTFEDSGEATRAFLEKRSPVWSWR